MSEQRIKQFKLSNNDEVICEIVEWPEEESDSPDVIVRSCMKVIVMEDYSRGVRFYAFRPWFTFSNDPGHLQILNYNHILGESNPSKELLKHYAKSIVEVKRAGQGRVDLDMDSVAENLENMDDDQFERFMSDMMDNGDSDHDPSNIIKFPNRNKMH